MSAPDERTTHRRRWWPGVVVAVAVLAVGLVVLALLPRTTTATASLTVTPRTDAGADAASMLADRYTALATSTDTLGAARNATSALADVDLDELIAGTGAARAGGTITVRVSLADRDHAVAAANAVVDALVAAGSAEALVHIDRGTDATAARAPTTPEPVRWTVVVLLLAAAGGLTAGAVAGRRRDTRPDHVPAPAPPAPSGRPATAEVVDDLPGFAENPPGSPTVAPAFPVAATQAVPSVRTGAMVPVNRPPALSVRGVPVATGTAVALLVAAAALVAVPADRAGGAATDTSAVGSSRSAPPATPTGSPAPGPDATAPPTSAPAPATEPAAAALALESVPLGDAGVAASVTFQGVVLEQRAVGLTVTYPSVSVTTDGSRSLAHVRLPTFNCLTAEPPADPMTAGCARSLTEYADLAGPQLQLSRTADGVQLSGLFATYTRPNGSAPGYTGRAYQVAATITADGPQRDGAAPAAGVVRIGLDSAPTTADPEVNVLQSAG